MKRLLVTLVVVAVLAAGGWFAWSHAHDVPAAATARQDWCATHGLPESKCPFCHHELLEQGGECGEHGVPEAVCVACDAALAPAFEKAKAAGDWCAEHALPESLCVKCHPELLEKVGTPNASAATNPGEVTLEELPADEVPRSRRSPSPTCRTERLRVHFASVETARHAGLEFARVEKRPVHDVLVANAETEFAANRFARVAARHTGVLREVRKELGDAVAAGDVLAIVEVPEIGSAKAEIRHAQELVAIAEKSAARERQLLEKGLATERESLDADTKLAEARLAFSGAEQRLVNLGATDADVAAVAAKDDRSPLVEIRAPVAGTVVERAGVAGEAVDPSRSLFAVADTHVLWAMIDVAPSDVNRVTLGSAVVLEPQGATGERFAGKVTWIAAQADAKTRTVRVRAEIDDESGRLRAGQFARALVTVHGGEAVLVVPKAAVQWDGCCNVAFVRRSDTLFEPRKLRLGGDAGEFRVLEHGLAEGEDVVTQGSYLLRTEIVKGAIGAGCCGD